jgi:hypothetical protein
MMTAITESANGRSLLVSFFNAPRKGDGFTDTGSIGFSLGDSSPFAFMKYLFVLQTSSVARRW